MRGRRRALSALGEGSAPAAVPHLTTASPSNALTAAPPDDRGPAARRGSALPSLEPSPQLCRETTTGP
jgi:hypothetical protein